jgi:hypothetical protein
MRGAAIPAWDNREKARVQIAVPAIAEAAADVTPRPRSRGKSRAPTTRRPVSRHTAKTESVSSHATKKVCREVLRARS